MFQIFWIYILEIIKFPFVAILRYSNMNIAQKKKEAKTSEQNSRLVSFYYSKISPRMALTW